MIIKYPDIKDYGGIPLINNKGILCRAFSCLLREREADVVTNEKLNELSVKTGIAVKQLNRLNQDMWYHGTTMDAYDSICEQGVLSSYNIGTQLDFGAGFYLTDSIEAASRYMKRLPELDASGVLTERTEWCVIEFEFNPFHLLFETENQYKYCNFPKHDENFAKFVFENRLNNVYNERPHGYDLIWGVMSDSIPPEIIMAYLNQEITYENAIHFLQKPQSMKQLFIGNQDICNMLKISRLIRFDKKEEA